MFGLGTQELIVVSVILAILFGAKKLPELGKGIGEAIKGFKKSVSDTEEKIINHDKPKGNPSEEGKEKNQAASPE